MDNDRIVANNDSRIYGINSFALVSLILYDSSYKYRLDINVASEESSPMKIFSSKKNVIVKL